MAHLREGMKTRIDGVGIQGEVGLEKRLIRISGA